MVVHSYFRWAFGLGFDAYRNTVRCLDIYIGPLTIEFGGGEGLETLAAGSDPASGECQHSWTNWSALETMDMQVTSIYAGDAPRASVESVVQTRHCLKCNLHQRTRIW